MTVKRENLIQIEDKLYQKCKIHLLLTDNVSNIWLRKSQLMYSKGCSPMDESIPQHIYITSDEEIKEGDWLLHLPTNKIIKYSKKFKYNYLNIVVKKIIATTDTSLKITKYNDDEHPIDSYSYLLPQPSQEFINRYIEEYNKRNKIEDILVEYKEIQWSCNAEKEFAINFEKNDPKNKGKSIDLLSFDIQLKIDKNNCITIIKVKDSWSREEVSELIHKYEKDMLYYGRDGYYNDCFPKVTDKWILENL